MLCGNNFFISLFDFGLSKRLCLKVLKNKCPLGICYGTHQQTSTSQAMELEEKIYCQKITTVLARNGLFLVLAAKYDSSQDRKSFITHSK